MAAKHKEEKWRTDQLNIIKSVSNPTATQRLLLELAEKQGKSPAETRAVDTVYKAIYAELQISGIKEKAAKIAKDTLAASADSARKARNHRLIGLGLLIEQAGLSERTNEELTGALLAIASVTDGGKWDAWREAGAKRIALRDAAKTGGTTGDGGG